MKGPFGYGRYDDDHGHVGCPRAKTDMTPCIARDGRFALADDQRCVGCGANPAELLFQLAQSDAGDVAEGVASLVRIVTADR